MSHLGDRELSRQLGFCMDEVYKRRPKEEPLQSMNKEIKSIIDKYGNEGLETPQLRHALAISAGEAIEQVGPSL